MCASDVCRGISAVEHTYLESRRDVAGTCTNSWPVVFNLICCRTVLPLLLRDVVFTVAAPDNVADRT